MIGGGDGYGGQGLWAAGAGGGYSSVSKRTPEGNHTLIVAGGKLFCVLLGISCNNIIICGVALRWRRRKFDGWIARRGNGWVLTWNKS